MSGITIVDYGMGNLHSAVKRLRRIGADPRVTADPRDVAAASKLVLPGVGHFGRAMQNLEATGLKAALDVAVMERGVPILGICLGMQLLAQHSEEGDTAGLGWIAAEVVRFSVRDTVRHKVPQIGWNTMTPKKDSELIQGVPADSEFYFVHSFHLVCENPADVLGETVYEYPFASAVARANIYGVQFHPEKSHHAGETLLRNFVSL